MASSEINFVFLIRMKLFSRIMEQMNFDVFVYIKLDLKEQCQQSNRFILSNSGMAIS